MYYIKKRDLIPIDFLFHFIKTSLQTKVRNSSQLDTGAILARETVFSGVLSKTFRSLHFGQEEQIFSVTG